MSEKEKDPAFERLLEYLKRHRGFDFTGYKRTSLMRRVRRRMDRVEIDTYRNTLIYLNAET